MAHDADRDSSHGAPSPGFDLCFLNEDTLMSPRRPGSVSVLLPRGTQGPGWVGTHPESHSKLLHCTLAAFRALRHWALGSKRGWWWWWGLGPLPRPTWGLTAISPPLPRLSLFSLQQKTPCCAQPAHHYQASRAFPARLGRRGGRGGNISGGLRTPACRSFGGLGPSAAPGLCHPYARTRLPVGSP